MKWPLLAGLNDEDLRRVLSSTRRRQFARNEPIFHEGDPGDTMHLLARGHVAVRVSTPLGDILTLRIHGPGAYFGELAIVSPAPRIASVVAIDAVETLSLHRDDIRQLRADHPAVELVLTDALIAEVRRLSAQLLESYYVPVAQRVVRRLADLADLFAPEDDNARNDEGDNEAVIPITQDELAQLAGAARPTTNTALQALQRDGLLTIDRGRITIQDVRGLRHRDKRATR